MERRVPEELGRWDGRVTFEEERQVVLAVILLAAAFVLAGCSLKIGWMSTSSKASMKRAILLF
jgi:hypothetical protein